MNASAYSVVSLPVAGARWLHRWAVVTVILTALLVPVGAVVTTLKVGMADPYWPTYPWHLFLVSWQDSSIGYLIEHSHRFLGYVVGLSTIVLALGLQTDGRPWLRKLGLLALGGVIVQGLLGGFRVRLHEWVGTDLALIHGCFAQVVFALLVSIALFTSPGWRLGAVVQASDGLRRSAVHLVALAFVQLVLGAVLRHTASPLGPRGHFLMAFGVVAMFVWAARGAFRDAAGDRQMTRAVRFLAILLVCQLLLGVEAWMFKLASGGLADYQPMPPHQAAIRTTHVLFGSWILAGSVVVALRAYRAAFDSPRPSLAEAAP